MKGHKQCNECGETFMSLSLEPKGVQDSAPSRSFEQGQNVNEFEDDIPF